MRKVIESELGEKLLDAFAEFDETPIAAASIGQVYRAVAARRPRGRRQGPVPPRRRGGPRGHAEPRDARCAWSRASRRGSTSSPPPSRSATRIHEELDYELEAGNQRALARIFRGHPFIVVPDVVTELSRGRVMVSEFVDGRGFDAIRECPRPTRDRFGEILFRFYFGCMYRHRQFSGDPHPGNSMLLPDGRVAFLDFGLFKHMPPELIEIELASQRAGHERDAQALFAIWSETGFLPNPDRFGPEKLLAQFVDSTWWYVDDAELELTPRIASDVVIEMTRPALVALRADAPRVAARRPPLRPPRGDADARGAGPAAGDRPTGTGSRASGCTTTTR